MQMTMLWKDDINTAINSRDFAMAEIIKLVLM
jgi:hypothetical protein